MIFVHSSSFFWPVVDMVSLEIVFNMWLIIYYEFPRHSWDSLCALRAEQLNFYLKFIHHT